VDRKPSQFWQFDKTLDGYYGRASLMLPMASGNLSYAPAEIDCQGTIWVLRRVAGRSNNRTFGSRPPAGLHELRDEMLAAEDALAQMLTAALEELRHG
jgi:hypothetical protein